MIIFMYIGYVKFKIMFLLKWAYEDSYVLEFLGWQLSLFVLGKINAKISPKTPIFTSALFQAFCQRHMECLNICFPYFYLNVV